MSVQSQHALTEFIFSHPEIAKEWYQKSNYLCFLSVSNEIELKKLIDKASEREIKFSIFREPDIGNEITAITLAPGKLSKKLCSSLPLALKNK
jgi:hypothetical protein